MTKERDFERLLDQWLSDGPTESPDRVLEAVADRIERQSQRPAWRLHRRLIPMTTPLKAAAGMAAVILAAVVGFNLIGGSSGPGGPSPTPSPTPTPIPMPAGPLAAGTYAFTVRFGPPALPIPKVILTLPDGWDQTNGILSDDSSSTTIVIWQVDEVYAHPCQWSVPRIQPGPTVDDLASALATVPLRNATTPVDVTVDGYAGKYLEWSVPDGIDFATCDKDGGTSLFKSWTATDGGDRYQQEPGQVDRLWILDIDGVRVVIDAWFVKDTTEADRAELTQIVNGIRFEP